MKNDDVGRRENFWSVLEEYEEMGFRAQLEGLALDKKMESASQYQVGGKCG